MKKIQSFDRFSEGFGKIGDYLNNILRKGGKFASDVWEGTKREKEETKIAVEILSRMMKGESVSDNEKEFLKKQSIDIVKILPLVAIQGIPIPIPITPVLIMLGRKYGFDFLPKDHRDLLKDQENEDYNSDK